MVLKQALRVFPMVVMLVCCATFAPALAQTSSSPSSPAPKTPPQPVSTDEPAAGVISGSVVNESGQPLAGVAVAVVDANPRGANRSTTTDAEGNFRVRGLMPGLYFVSASLAAYVRQPFEPWPPASYYRVGDTARITMTPGGVITGRVTNADGEPVIGVGVLAVMVRNAAGEKARLEAYAASETTTDDRGVYRLFGLPAGSYIVSAGGGVLVDPFKLNPYGEDVPTYSPSSPRDTASEIAVRTGEESTADIRYQSEPGHVVSGTMKIPVAATGAVSLTAVGGVFPIAHAFQQAGSRGFAFKGIADGEYEIVGQEMQPPSPTASDLPTSEPQRITVKGADVTDLELVTRLPASLSGRIVLDQANVTACENKRLPLFAEMLVALQRPEKDAKDRVPFLRTFSGPAYPDSNGNFVMRNVVPGKYLLEPRFFARYWYLDSISVTATPKIDAAANWTNVKLGERLTGFTITLAKGAASIRGKVKTANASELPAGLAVYLVPAEREKSGDVLRYFVTSVETNGTFALNNLPPGRYHAVVQPLETATSTLFKLRLPDATEARTKLRRTAETQKTDLELKPCQNLTDHEVTFKP